MTNRKRISDLTLLLIVRLDTIDRLENVLAVTKFITSHCIVKITVLESAPINNSILKRLLDKSIQYTFQVDLDPILYRTRFLNQMIQSVKTPFVAVWDIDIVLQIDQLLQAMKLLRTGEADFVFPYEKYALDTSHILRKLYFEEGKFEVLEQNMKKMQQMYAPNPVGGIFLANLQAYIESGLENENFYGWGLEDVERYNRWMNLGYKIKRVPGPIFHLNHGRGNNSVYHNGDQQFSKIKEVARIQRNKNGNGFLQKDEQVPTQ